jgi:RNase H-like domain found in reverse transcriptase
VAFHTVKELLENSAELVLMTENDPLVIYTDASTNAIGGVLMQIQDGIERPCCFVSHALSDQATRWRIMELELFASWSIASNIFHHT